MITPRATRTGIPKDTHLLADIQGRPVGATDQPRGCANPTCDTFLSRYNLTDELCGPCRTLYRRGHLTIEGAE
jgi:hypothetical protein